MDQPLSFIETQFPVSKVSKESYKERKSSQGQTITGLGKWWGRKPLLLVRSAILGCLMPASDCPQKDTEIFLKLMSMDEKGLYQRKDKDFTIPQLYDIVHNHRHLHKYEAHFDLSDGKPKLYRGIPRELIEHDAFNTLSYDEKIAMCCRPEHVTIKDDQTWNEINQHLHTHASSIDELIQQLSIRKFGHNVIVGDCFCGGGSIPFEAARIGCEAYASDLNPIAGLLTWADLHVCGGSHTERTSIESFQNKVYQKIDKDILDLGIEQNEHGDRALSYLYCAETGCPECGWTIPLLPSLVVGIRAGRVIVDLVEIPATRGYDFKIQSDVSTKVISEAQKHGTVRNNMLVCPHCGRSTPIPALRHDRTDDNGHTVSGLRLWEKGDYKPRPEDVFQERLYAVRYERIEVLPNGKTRSFRYYTEPSQRDLDNEVLVDEIVGAHLNEWQNKGWIPSAEIQEGSKTDELTRNRGWRYWHHVFNPRQLLLLSKLAQYTQETERQENLVAGILGINKCADFNSKLCRWNPNCDKSEQTFYNQALNTLMNWGVRSLKMIKATGNSGY